jgi:hypothetical protein
MPWVTVQITKPCRRIVEPDRSPSPGGTSIEKSKSEGGVSVGHVAEPDELKSAS